jgi:hypothetical protein
MQLVLVQVRHLVRPRIDRLAALESDRISNLLSAPKMTNGIGFLHSPDGKGNLHGVSSPFHAEHLLQTDNSCMGEKKKSAHTDDLSTFAGRLRHAMDRKGANANRIEVKTGAITRQAIGMMLSGQTGKPSWAKLVLLSTYLGVRPEWLAEGESPMFPAPVLKDEEVSLIEHYRAMSRTHQKDLRDIAERWSDEDDGNPGHHSPHSPRPHRRQ